MNTETSVNSFKSGAFWKRSFSPKTSENEGFWKRWPKHSFHIYSIYFSLRFRWSVNVEERRKCIEMCVSSLNTLFCAVKTETNTSVAKNIFFLFVGHKNLLFWDQMGKVFFSSSISIRFLKSGSEIVISDNFVASSDRNPPITTLCWPGNLWISTSTSE